LGNDIGLVGDVITQNILPDEVGVLRDIGSESRRYQTIYCDLLDAKLIKKTWSNLWVNNNSVITPTGATSDWCSMTMDQTSDIGGSESDPSIAFTPKTVDPSRPSLGYTPILYHNNPNVPEMYYHVTACIVFHSTLATANEIGLAFFKNGYASNDNDLTGLLPSSLLGINDKSSVAEPKEVSTTFIVSLKVNDRLHLKCRNITNPAGKVVITFLKVTVMQV
jgi:hypothetical protein